MCAKATVISEEVSPELNFPLQYERDQTIVHWVDTR